jgi:Mrp family chromosome partitioning ATPase
MQNIAASAQKAYDANDALVISLKKQMETVKAEAGSATLDEGSIESMVRDTEIKRQQYAELYKKASELETEQRVLQGSTRLVSLAELPNKPFFPKKSPFLAAGSTLALILAIAAALLMERFKVPQIRRDAPAAVPATRPAVESASVQNAGSTNPIQDKPNAGVLPIKRTTLLSMMAGVPVLARLPRLREPQQGSIVGAILQSHLKPSITDVLRLAANNDDFQAMLHNLKLGLRLGANPGQRIVVTSQGSGDGKTATTLALAEHLAAFGYRVLVVECDVLNACFEQVFGLDGGVGLLGALAGAVNLRDAIIQTTVPSLDVLVAGAAGAKAASLLFGNNLSKLLADVGNYDAVLVDSPLPLNRNNYLAGIDHVVVCMRGDGSLIGRAASTVSEVKAFAASSVVIAVTMEETRRATAERAFVATEAYVRAG